MTKYLCPFCGNIITDFYTMCNGTQICCFYCETVQDGPLILDIKDLKIVEND